MKKKETKYKMIMYNNMCPKTNLNEKYFTRVQQFDPAAGGSPS